MHRIFFHICVYLLSWIGLAFKSLDLQSEDLFPQDTYSIPLRYSPFSSKWSTKRFKNLSFPTVSVLHTIQHCLRARVTATFILLLSLKKPTCRIKSHASNAYPWCRNIWRHSPSPTVLGMILHYHSPPLNGNKIWAFLGHEWQNHDIQRVCWNWLNHPTFFSTIKESKEWQYPMKWDIIHARRKNIDIVYLMLFIGPHHGDDYSLLFPTLETIHSTHFHICKFLILSSHTLKQSHLLAKQFQTQLWKKLKTRYPTLPIGVILYPNMTFG